MQVDVLDVAYSLIAAITRLSSRRNVKLFVQLINIYQSLCDTKSNGSWIETELEEFISSTVAVLSSRNSLLTQNECEPPKCCREIVQNAVVNHFNWCCINCGKLSREFGHTILAVSYIYQNKTNYIHILSSFSFDSVQIGMSIG